MADIKTVDLMLYVGGQWRSADLDKSTSFSFNLQASDITDPTATKIPYSSQISLPQTKENDDIFSLIGEYGSTILNINPLLRTDFVLYVNGTVFQRGYMQVESIDRLSRTYKVRLFGGLGDYFYTLSDIKIKDLEFGNFFNHTINRSNLFTFWNSGSPAKTYHDYASGEDVTEEVFNYAMTYQGYYENFDSGYYVNNADDHGEVAWASGNKNYTAGRELTEHERSFIRGSQRYGEYRSYQQKPMVKMKPLVNKIIETMAREENGGWETYLDPSFFNKYNPYWESLWMVCPNYETTNDQRGDTFEDLPSSEEWTTGENVSPVFAGTNLSTNSSYRTITISNGYQFEDGEYTFSAEIDFNLLTTQLSGDNDSVDKWFSAFIRVGLYIDGKLVGDLEDIESGDDTLDLNNSTCGAKNVVKFRGETGQGPTTNPFYIERSTSTTGKYYTVSGIQETDKDARGIYKFKRTFSYTPDAGTHNIEIRLMVGGNTNWHAPNGVRERGLRFLMQGGSVSISTSDGSGTRTDANITYKSIIRSEDSCFDLLMSYLKPFGFHFVKDKVKNRVSILTRNTYFGLRERRDWTYKIDYSKQHIVQPTPFQYKVGVLKWRDLETKYEEQYLSKYSKEYGSLRFDTGYQFNDEEKNYLENNIFGNGIIVTGFSNYFLDRNRTLYKDNKEILHFQDSGDDAVDTGYVLCFKDGFNTVPVSFTITDDNPYMLELGYSYTDIGTSSTRYPAVKRTMSEGNQNYSLNFGRPEVAYNDSESNLVGDTDGGQETLYSRFWQGYLQDRFDEENRVLTCYVDLTLADVYEDLFNKFIFIRNTPYVINKITGFNPLSNQTTKVELISVRSIDGYVSQRYIEGKMTLNYNGNLIYDSSNEQLSDNPVVLTFNNAARDITFNIGVDPSLLAWNIIDQGNGVDINPSSGSGPGSFVVSIPESTSDDIVSYYVPIQWGNSTTILQIIQESRWTVRASSNHGVATINGNTFGSLEVANGETVVLDTINVTGYAFAYWEVEDNTGQNRYYDKQLTLPITSDTLAYAYWYSPDEIGWENSEMWIDWFGSTLINTLYVPTGLTFTITAEDLTFDPTSGAGSRQIVFNVPQNTTTGYKFYTAVATYSNGYSATFTIVQFPPDRSPTVDDVPEEARLKAKVELINE